MRKLRSREVSRYPKVTAHEILTQLQVVTQLPHCDASQNKQDWGCSGPSCQYVTPHAPCRLGSGLHSPGQGRPELWLPCQLPGRVRGRQPGGGSATPPHVVMPIVPSEMSDSLLEDLIAAHLVLPNRVTVPVKKGLDVTNLRFPLPCVSTCTS